MNDQLHIKFNATGVPLDYCVAAAKKYNVDPAALTALLHAFHIACLEATNNAQPRLVAAVLELNELFCGCERWETIRPFQRMDSGGAWRMLGLPLPLLYVTEELESAFGLCRIVMPRTEGQGGFQDRKAEEDFRERLTTPNALPKNLVKPCTRTQGKDEQYDLDGKTMLVWARTPFSWDSCAWPKLTSLSLDLGREDFAYWRLQAWRAFCELAAPKSSQELKLSKEQRVFLCRLGFQFESVVILSLHSDWCRVEAQRILEEAGLGISITPAHVRFVQFTILGLLEKIGVFPRIRYR